MAPNNSFNLPFRPGKKPVGASLSTLCFRPKASSTAVARTSQRKDRDGDEVAKKKLKRVLESALQETSTTSVDKFNFQISAGSEPYYNSELATSQRAPDPNGPEAEQATDAREACEEIEWDEQIEAKPLKRERADAKKQKLKRAAEAQKARNSLIKSQHNESEMLSMLSGFKVNVNRKSAGISKASRFKTPTIDYTKLQRQGKALVKAAQDRVLPAETFWRDGLESRKERDEHIANAAERATYLQESRVRVHSCAAWNRARERGERNGDGTPRLLR
ncbi:uncharacterized protein MYCFIDRAFT_78271 [Pseudocercospora fijiensis CIRAD86]|uniref:Uncharacterized protein n=1 Tax=Pseudocercospora fijiensis (strain CIRAD86) TaxID=383855 RepID=M3ASV3_PSEFD|nr:uncharacterized protein MYCFIDRAFT_78271 [Pseudocercospora fijiensis CIRAD86]EME80572.1 hypothetical protein MYCFIDRAFT_78271 [Pseudocercospora fijiensis CIRAD86]